MEIILLKRNKALTFLLFIVIATISVYLFYFKNFRNNENRDITAFIDSKVKRIQELIRGKKEELNIRSEILYKKYSDGKMNQTELLPGEALIFEKEGVVNNYYGEVFYFKAVNIPIKSSIFLKKESKLYYLKKLDKNIYYVSDFSDLREDFFGIKREIPFVYSEIKFFDTPVKHNKNPFHLDRVSGIFYFNKNLDSMNDQVLLTVKFLRRDFTNFQELKKDKTNSFLLLILLVLIYLVFVKRHGQIVIKSLYFILFNILLMIFLARVNNSESLTLFLNSDFGSVHTALVFYLSTLFLILMNFFGKTHGFSRTKTAVSFLIFSFLPVGLKNLLKNLSFTYSQFKFLSFSTLLIISVFIFSFAALLLLKNVNFKASIGKKFVYLISIAFFAIISSFLFGSWIIIYLNLYFCIFLTVLFRKTISFDVLSIFFLSVVIFLMFFLSGRQEKETFISSGLKDIFSNQNNYAKFISREIIHNFNLKSTNMSHFFKKGMNSELKNIWRTSIAAKENISTGIYVVNKEGEVLSSFSYRIPYLNIKIKKFFPFWEIDEFKTVYYGNTVSLAVAYLNVYKGYDYLGRIVIQVIDSSDLIVKDRNLNSIFLLNSRVDGENLSYIKLNSENQIVENPSNITLHDINRLVNSTSRWIEFRSMDIFFRGYVFKTNENTLVIYYPESNLSEISSEIIRIFLLFLVINMFIHIRDIFNLDWKNIFRSFSFQVFTILILLSLVTTVFFSIFTIQYNRRSIGLNYRSQIYASDGIAFNILSDIIEKERKLDQNHLFFLSKILDSDISVYSGNELMDTSNYKKILYSEIPLFINSRIADGLKLKKERFIIGQKSGSYSSFFKIYDYIVRIDHPYKTSSDLMKGKLFLNFIVNLFFVLTLLGIFLALVFRNKIIFPINKLNKKMADVKDGKLDLIKDIPKEIEIKNLFSGFNSMIKGISAQRKKISEISRMRILVKISRWIAHEVKNPLTPIKLSAEQILKSLNDRREGYEDIVKESVNYIITETEHLKNIAHGFLDFSNINELKSEEFDLVDLCSAEIEKLKKVFNGINFHIQSDIPYLPVLLDKIKIRQVLKNILSNSIEAMPERKGDITIRIIDSKQKVTMQIIDTGKGLKDLNGEDIFSEEFSSKENGTGLGLYIVKRIVELHRGEVGIKEDKGGNTVVTIVIPKKSDSDQNKKFKNS